MQCFTMKSNITLNVFTHKNLMINMQQYPCAMNVNILKNSILNDIVGSSTNTSMFVVYFKEPNREILQHFQRNNWKIVGTNENINVPLFTYKHNFIWFRNEHNYYSLQTKRLKKMLQGTSWMASINGKETIFLYTGTIKKNDESNKEYV